MRAIRVGLIVGILFCIIFCTAQLCPAETPLDLAKSSAGRTAVERSWSDSTGRFHTEGILLGGDRFKVRLRKASGSIITVEMARLSAPDRQFVLNSLGARAASADWMAGLGAKLSSLATPPDGDSNLVAIAGRLIMEPATPMPENMLYVRLSRRFLERVSCPVVDQHAAVVDTILGYNVVGDSQTTGTTEFVLQPSDSCALAEVHLFGTTIYNTIADAGAIQVHTSGITRFASAKALRFDGQGIHLGPAATNAQTSARITGIETSLPGLRGRIALRIGGPRAEQSRPAAEAVTAQHSQCRVDQRFDATANEQVAELSTEINSLVAVLPADHPLRQSRWQASSTKDTLQIVLLAPPGDKATTLPAPAPMFADGDVEVLIHVALVRSALADVRLQRLLQPVTVRLASLQGTMPTSQPVIRWSQDHKWLSLGLRSGERPSEPAQPKEPVIASREQ